MHLLMVTDRHPRDEPFLREVYAKRWKRTGEITFVMEATDETSPGIKKWKGHRLHILPHGSYNHLKAAKRYVTEPNPLKPIIDDNMGFDIIQVRNDLALGLDAVSAAGNYETPFVYRLSHLKSEGLQLGYRMGLPGFSVIDYAKGAAGKRVRRLLANRADVVFTISEEMSIHLKERGYQSQLRAMPMAADTTLDPATINPEAFLSEWDVKHVPYLVYIGTMNPIRQLEFLFPVMKYIRQKEKKDIKLVMVGGRSEPNRERLRRAAHSRGVSDAVIFTGWISSKKLRQAVVGAKAGLSPIPENYVLRTNSPTKLMEYLNLSTPAVATPTPEQKNVLKESGAGKLATREVSEFGDAICHLITDEKHRKELGRKGRKYIVSNRSYDHVYKNVKNYYESMV